MLQPTRRDWQMLSSTASIPWLREVIEDSLPPDADDDEVLTVDVLLTTAPVSVSPDVLTDWVVDRARAFGLASVERHADALVEGVTCWRAPDGTASQLDPAAARALRAHGVRLGVWGQWSRGSCPQCARPFSPARPRGHWRGAAGRLNRQ